MNFVSLVGRDPVYVDTTPEVFDRFTRFVLNDMELLGLGGWHVNFRMFPDAPADDRGVPVSAASIDYDNDQHVCTFSLAPRLHEAFTDDRLLKALAMHEVLHLLFSEFDLVREFVLEAKLPKETVNRWWQVVEHSLIRRLEQALFLPYEVHLSTEAPQCENS